MKEFCKTFLFFTLVSFCLTTVFFLCTGYAQEQNNIAAFGLGYSATADPSIMGWGAYGKLVGSTTAVFTDFDVFRASPQDAMGSVAGLRLKYSIRTGVAQQLVRISNKFSLWGLFNGGIGADGQSVVRSLQYGGFVDVPIKKGIGVLAILAAEDNPITGRDFAPRVGMRFKF